MLTRLALGDSAQRRLGIRLLAALGVVLALACCESGPTDRTVHLAGSTMGTRYELKLVPDPGQTVPADFPVRVETLLADINRQMSTYDPDSELSRFNRNPSNDWIPASPELVTVAEEGLRLGQLTDGAFDITIGPLVNLWGFGPEPRPDQVPSEAAISQARQQVGFRMLQLRHQPPALKKARPDLSVDLSALAKGYAVDQLAALAERHGIQHFLVSIGGDVRAKGHNGHGQAWTIAIERPVPGQRAVQRLLRLNDQAVSTAGDYRNFFEQDGQRYAHILDPRTGWPVARTVASVTVIAASDLEADATDTALMAAGAERGWQLAVAHHIAAFFILVGANGEGFSERYTPEFAPFLQAD